MLPARASAGRLGIFEAAAEGTEPRRAESARFPHSRQLPARLRARAGGRGISRRRLVHHMFCID